MWISRVVCRLSRRSSNKFAAMSKWAKKPQEALDRHAARLVKESRRSFRSDATIRRLGSNDELLYRMRLSVTIR